MKKPFFAQFLENQLSESEQQNSKGGRVLITKPAFDLDQTMKYPSDSDEGDVTMKYPSDNDEGELF